MATVEIKGGLAALKVPVLRQVDQGVFFEDAGQWGIDLAFDGVHYLPEGHRTFARSLLQRLEQYKNW